MTIIRTIHDKSNPYVILNKASLWDENLPLEAVGLWARLMSKPDNWSVSTTHLQRSCQIGEHKALKLLKILQENGYSYRFQPRKGKFQPWETLVFETKKTAEEIKEILTLRGFTLAEVPHAENSTLTNTDIPNPSSFHSEVKETATSEPKKEPAAASSIRKKLKKSKVKQEDWDDVLCYYEHNKAEIDSKSNPMGWLIKMWEVGKHKEKKKNVEVIKARKKWAEGRCYTTGSGSVCTTKEGMVKTDGSGQTIFKWDSNDMFWQVNGLGFNDFD